MGLWFSTIYQRDVWGLEPAYCSELLSVFWHSSSGTVDDLQPNSSQE